MVVFMSIWLLFGVTLILGIHGMEDARFMSEFFKALATFNRTGMWDTIGGFFSSVKGVFFVSFCFF